MSKKMVPNLFHVVSILHVNYSLPSCCPTCFPASLRQRSSAWVLLWASYKGSETEHLSKGEHHFHVCIRVCTSLKLYAYTTYCICITVVYCEMTIKMNGTSATTVSSTNMLDSSWFVGFLWSSHCIRLSNLSPWARPPAAPLLLPATPNAFTFTWKGHRKNQHVTGYIRL